MSIRTLTSEEELDALPDGSVVVCLQERSNPRYPSIFLKTGGYEPWLEMDPSDRDDGERGVGSRYIILHESSKSCELVWEPQP